MMLKLDIRRKVHGFYPVDGGAGPHTDAQGYRNGGCVELYFGDRGMLDMVEPTVVVTLKPEEALVICECLRVAALACRGSHDTGVGKE